MHFMLGVVASTRTATSKIGYNEIILAAYIVCLQVAACVAIKLAKNGEIWPDKMRGKMDQITIHDIKNFMTMKEEEKCNILRTY